MANSKAVDTVWGILAFQYKPLEAKLLRDCKEEGRLDVIRQYKSLSTAKKIKILDEMAGMLGM